MIWFVEGKLYFWDVDKKIRTRIDNTLGSPKDRLFTHQKDKETAKPHLWLHMLLGIVTM